MERLNNALRNGEEGHGTPMIGALAAAVGAILLGIGAANDTGVLAVIGGIVLAVGIVATLVLQHMTVEWGIFGRLEKLEK